jgi:hypothetical protein
MFALTNMSQLIAASSVSAGEFGWVTMVASSWSVPNHSTLKGGPRF